MTNEIQTIFQKVQFRIATRQLRRLPRFQSGSVSLFGSNYRYADSQSFLSAYREIYLNEVYQFQTNSPCPVFIDAGANVGLATLYLLQNHPTARVIAFEPDPNVAACYQENTKDFQSQIQLHQVALGKQDGRITFYQEGGDSGSIVDSSNGAPLEVPVRKLSPFLPDHIDFMKLDIEGAELDVIQECSSILDRVERLFIEIHCYNNDRQENLEVLRLLGDAGFRCFPSTVYSLFDRYNIASGPNGLDLAINVFAVRQDQIKLSN